MRYKRTLLRFALLFLFSVSGAACSPNFIETSAPTPQNRTTPTFTAESVSITRIQPTPTTQWPTPTRTPSISPSSTLPPAPAPTLPGVTPRPTLGKYTSEKEIGEFLKDNGGCDLPCVWGIIPGETTLDQGIEKLSYLGWKGSLYNRSTYYSSTSLMDSTHINFGLYHEDEIITGIIFSFTHQQYTLLDQYYSITRLLSRTGAPSQIWINLATRTEAATRFVGFDLYLFYEDLGILAKYPGVAILQGDQYQLCPTHPYASAPNSIATEGAVVLYLGGPQEQLTPEDLARPFDRFGVKLTVAQALGITPEQFNRQMVTPTDGQACFYTARSIWP